MIHYLTAWPESGPDDLEVIFGDEDEAASFAQHFPHVIVTQVIITTDI